MSSLSLSEISVPPSMNSSSLKKFLTIPFLMAIAVFPFLSDEDIFSFASCSKFTVDMFEDQFFSYENKCFSNIGVYNSFRISKSLLKRMKKKNGNIVNLVYMLEQNNSRINLAKFIPVSVRILKLWTSDSFYYRKINLSSFTNLKYLEVPTNYNKPIKSFPPNLVVLKFDLDSNFNKPLLNLPSSLRWLELGDKFNQSIVLNEGLEYVRFGKHFNYPIKSLPSSLIYLELGQDFDWTNMKTELPTNLRDIHIHRNDNSESDSIMRQIIEMNPTISNIIIYFDRTTSLIDNISSYALDFKHAIQHHIPFVLSTGNNIIQFVGKYIRIQHLFCREIQDFMENETMNIKSEFNSDFDLIAKISDRKTAFIDERYLIVTIRSKSEPLTYTFLENWWDF